MKTQVKIIKKILEAKVDKKYYCFVCGGEIQVKNHKCLECNTEHILIPKETSCLLAETFFIYSELVLFVSSISQFSSLIGIITEETFNNVKTKAYDKIKSVNDLLYVPASVFREQIKLELEKRFGTSKNDIPEVNNDAINTDNDGDTDANIEEEQNEEQEQDNFTIFPLDLKKIKPKGGIN